MNNGNSESALSPANVALLEDKFEEFQRNPESVDPQWREFFKSYDSGEFIPPARPGANGGAKNSGSNGHQAAGTSAPAGAASAGAGNGHLTGSDYESKNLSFIDQGQVQDVADLHMKTLLLLQAYRRHGHFAADTDPLKRGEPNRRGLKLEDHYLTEADLDREVKAYVAGKETTGKLRDLVNRMEKAYCSSIGTEYFYIRDENRRRWLMERLEATKHISELSKDEKEMIFDRLFQAEDWEKFLATRFPGKKRFSLEGGESLIPALSSVVENADKYGIAQIVLGMAHRGRLNVLANIMQKDPALIFAEFNENVPDDDRAGDVKYHMGYSSDVKTRTGNNVHLSLAFNPSHLEVINPVVLGSVRARQDRSQQEERTDMLPLIIHGDAAFAGQGLNYECLNMAQLPGYAVGGALHIIVNNQIGFTTGAEDARSTSYCTDLAKILQAPIFHVNGDDPEACYRAIQLCLEWRQIFQTDVFLDLVCYRRLGHNETDEPTFTQPLMYKKIKSLPTTFKLYETKLLDEGFEKEKLDQIKKSARETLEDAFQRVESKEVKVEREALSGNWTGFEKADMVNPAPPSTNVNRDKIESIAKILTTVPDDFKANKKIARLLDQRRAMVFDEDGKLDWGMAENLAYGTLLAENTSIRISGQDVKRGTFSHRHAAIFDSETGEQFVPLQGVPGEYDHESHFDVVNSLLSEMGALGFEFGYSLAEPYTLVIWEAQFGDFVNNAQVIIDQFISSCEAKWNRMSGLVMLLPHGYEGQGPEHSSARLERFLQLCSQNNIQVCNLTTPAQYFHLIRRQMKRNFRKPLVIMSPKSLLRHPQATSTVQELTDDCFLDVIDERDAGIDPQKVRRLVLCSGKIYYELKAAREERKIDDIAIATVEQIYPYPIDAITELLQKYTQATEITWCQEEPRNQGAWIYMENRLEAQISDKHELNYFGRPPSPSPATGYFKIHQKEQAQIIDRALTIQG
ncbi:MAG: 2-oxoglutarate dehydrogenase E1 component [bacterium]|nr:2-oxoglutarate dehydrogenase E1 component [bacterium]